MGYDFDREEEVRMWLIANPKSQIPNPESTIHNPRSSIDDP
jgi:hypothetical protein